MKKKLLILTTSVLILASLLVFPLAVNFTSASVNLPSVVVDGNRYYAGQEIIEWRQENSKSFVMPSGDVGLDIYMGVIHYKDNYADNNEQWKDIDLTWEGNYIGKAPYELWLEGNRAIVRDRKTGEISSLELLEVGGQHIPTQAWERSKGLAKAFDTDIEVVVNNTQISFTRILKSDTASREAKYRVTGSIPLQVSARDKEGELPIEWTLEDGILTETLKPNRPVKYPARIDPTLDIRTAANDDDCRVWWTGAVWDFSKTDTAQPAGYRGGTKDMVGGGMRFLNITIPNAETITTAYLIFKSRAALANNNVNSVIIGEDVDDAATFSDLADYQARRGTIVAGANDNFITAASVNWNVIAAWDAEEEGADTTSPEIKTIIQEIVDRGGWASGQNMVLFWDDHGGNSTAVNDTYRSAHSHDSDSAKAPKLHIEYSAPPSVTTNAAGSVTCTSAILNGEVTAVNDTNIIERGFVWGVADAGDLGDNPPPGAWDNNWTEAPGPWGIGAFTHTPALVKGTTYHYRACAKNDGGAGKWAYGADQTFTTLGDPTVTTDGSSLVEEITARLEGSITATGGVNATIRGFDWDIDTGAPYANNWNEVGDYGVAALTRDIAGLAEGELIFFRAYATNPCGTGYGAEDTFITKPIEPTGFSATAQANNKDIVLAWTNGASANPGIEIRRQAGSYPATVANGIQAYQGAVSPQTDAGLTGGQTYYYRAWSWANEGGKTSYSDLYVEANEALPLVQQLWYQPNAMISGTTLPDRAAPAQDGTITWGTNSNLIVTVGGMTGYASVTPSAGEVGEVSDTVTAAGQPAGWYGAGTGMTNLPFYAEFNSAATQMGMTTQTLYVFVMLGVATAVGLSVFLFTGSVLTSTLGAGGVIAMGAGTTVLSQWMVYVFIILALGVIYLAKKA